MVKNIVFVLLTLAAPFVMLKEARSATCSSTTTTEAGVGKSLWIKQPLLARGPSNYTKY